MFWAVLAHNKISIQRTFLPFNINAGVFIEADF